MVEWMDWLVPVIAIAGVVLFCVGCYFIADWRMRKRLLVCDATILENDLAGKRYVVTGGSSGLGFHTVIQLVKQGAHVFVGCRRIADSRVEKLKTEIKDLCGTMEVIQLDLSSLASVRKFAQETKTGSAELHGLVNNAGIMNCPLRRSNEGYEMQFATNYLGHFLLTDLLTPQLVAVKSKGRVVNLSSCTCHKPMGHKFTMEIDDLSFTKKKYNGWVGYVTNLNNSHTIFTATLLYRYGHSKLANVLHAKELAKRHGGSILATSLHPGSVYSNITRSMMSLNQRWATAYMEKACTGQISSWHGIQTTLFCLLADEGKEYQTGPSKKIGRIVNGAYYSQHGSPYTYINGSLVVGGWPTAAPNPQAQDDRLAAELYDRTVQMAGLAVLGEGVQVDSATAAGSTSETASSAAADCNNKVHPVSVRPAT